MNIEIEQLSKAYGDKSVLSNFFAVIPEGHITCVMGSSGQGKTTLLRILMGLEVQDSGKVTGLVGKRFSAVFQEDRLCENLSSVSNIQLTCSSSRLEILYALDQVGLSGCCSQPVRELSGGMRRRVSVLRALMADYDVLFLDEPFKGLDAVTKECVMADTKERSLGKTILLVTHEASEAKTLGADSTIYIGS